MSTHTTTHAAVGADVASRLRLVITRLGRKLRGQAGGYLTPSQASALASVERHGPITLGDLSAVENVRPPTLTKVITALEEQGLVARSSDPSDRRVARVVATTEGAELLALSRSAGHAYLAARLLSLPADDLAALERALDVLERLVETE